MTGRDHARRVVEQAAARCRLERSQGGLHQKKNGTTTGDDQDPCGLPLIARLLRYIDGRSYERARSNGQEPCVSISVSPSTIVIEYNDDGLRDEDVGSLCGLEDAAATCRPGSSSAIRLRAPSPVFHHARQVSLRSGDYAFCFRPSPPEPLQQHQQQEEEVVVELEVIDPRGGGTGGPPSSSSSSGGPRSSRSSSSRSSRSPSAVPARDGVSRLTLLLREDGDAGRAADQSSSGDRGLTRQVADLEPNHLLFLRQLRRMRIVFALGEETPARERMYTLQDVDEHVKRVTAAQRAADGLSTHESRYFVVRSPQFGVPSSCSSSSSSAATAATTTNPQHSNSSSSSSSSHPADCSEVVLAFPIDAGCVPSVESQQQVYRFFPLGNWGFKFLLQCDLLQGTEISTRQDHGLALLDHIAQAFAHASTLLCQHPSLRYVWPAYLPHQGHVTGDPWSSLVGRINDRVGQPVRRMRAGILHGGGESMALAATTLERCKKELTFLYLTDKQRSDEEDYQKITVVDQSLRPVRLADQDVYLPGLSRYSPEDLFRPVAAGADGSREGAPGFAASFLHPSILDDEPQQPDASHPTWKQWLVDAVGIRSQIRLISRAGDSPSAAFAYVAKHRHDGLLDILEQCWRSEGELVIANPQLLNCVKQVPVPCLSGFLHPLWETYLPLEDLQRRYLQFMEPQEAFPFVDLGGQTSAGDLANKWSFLYTYLGVSRNNDLGFLLDILSYVQLANLNGMSTARCRSVVRLYCELERRCTESMEPDSLRDICRSYVEDIQGVMIPSDCGSPSSWTDAKQCVWGPPSLQLTTRHQLGHMYEHALQLSRVEMEALSSFFRVTLDVRCVTLQDLTMELAALRDAGCSDVSRTGRIYECMSMLMTPETEQQARAIFDSDPLILVAPDGRPQWLRTSQCLWANPLGIDNRPAVGSHYGPLESLFVRTLGVGLLTMDMVYKRLLEVEHQKPPLTELKTGLWLFSSLLETVGRNNWPDPVPLLKRAVFPVRQPDGRMVAVSAETDFGIVDRKVLGQQLASQVKLLDFTLEEVALLKPLFAWAGLGQRYLSVCVSNMSFLDSDAAQFPISSLSRDLCHKAHALLRIAAAFGSPKYKRAGPRLYEFLRGTKVVETNAICSALSITQDGRVAGLQMVRSQPLHLAEEPSGLRIYVPRDRTAQDVCFATVLPRRLAQWLMQDPMAQTTSPAAVDANLVAILGSVLSVDMPVVEGILEHEGIGQVHLPAINQAAFEASTLQRAPSRGEGSGQMAALPTPSSSSIASPTHPAQAPQRRG
ncbi:ino80 chromatin remodeling complex protein [Purpureocillium lavendulum]|uniref:Ino80 chromatin remodeling complex protein n=1 Tax=Purpureocillium lavendulum TaxID=1247861 RepID=A0AB34G542_9HYPO|nr:ino80 chromatin remodeling complex protein [Purpureocillium lavendulum]